ncbi:MAG: CBS domain-containing protein [Hyphomicrobiaceae bacterium]|nr:CBS domain-containing protein [Hyphomicrobiaceae bacterium]
MRVSDVLNEKGRAVVTIKPSNTAAELSLLLRERRIGAAIVSSDGETIDGVISERDLAYSLCARGADLHALPVSELMTRQVITCQPHDSVGHVVSTMRARNIRHVPVVVDGRIAGMLSIRDMLNVRVDELQRQAAELRSFATLTQPVLEDR